MVTMVTMTASLDPANGRASYTSVVVTNQMARLPARVYALKLPRYSTECECVCVISRALSYL